MTYKFKLGLGSEKFEVNLEAKTFSDALRLLRQEANPDCQILEIDTEDWSITYFYDNSWYFEGTFKSLDNLANAIDLSEQK